MTEFAVDMQLIFLAAASPIGGLLASMLAARIFQVPIWKGLVIALVAAIAQGGFSELSRVVLGWSNVGLNFVVPIVVAGVIGKILGVRLGAVAAIYFAALVVSLIVSFIGAYLVISGYVGGEVPSPH